MAEAAAVIGLVASIASLVDLGIKLVARIREFTAGTLETPESFSALATRLPLLKTSLQLIERQAQAGRLPADVVVALTVLITGTAVQVSTVQKALSSIIPASDASRTQRALKALRSLAKEKDVVTAVEKIHQDIDFLVLHQATQHVEVGERILQELAKLQITSTISRQSQAKDTKHLGSCFGQAPVIPPDSFIGRAAEIAKMIDILRPDVEPREQRRVVLGGIGGMGKTQLALAYARQHQHQYTSTLWLNADSETSLHASLQTVARGLIVADELARLDKEQVLAHIHDWLSLADNRRWLLIFDNYDDPEQFDIDAFCPNIGQGSVIVTTRLPSLVAGDQVRLSPIQAPEDGVRILQARSGRVSAASGLFSPSLYMFLAADD